MTSTTRKFTATRERYLAALDAELETFRAMSADKTLETTRTYRVAQSELIDATTAYKSAIADLPADERKRYSVLLSA